MHAHLSHLLFNVRPANVAFYRDLTALLGWQTIYDEEGMLGVAGPHRASLWFAAQTKAVANDYDGPGLNHLGLGVETPGDVDAVTAYLEERGVRALFETPRHRPEFAESDEHTYYQVMFESPDRILLEVVYIGPKAVPVRPV
jgi:catechol 2,3-dioxygenase-like lactoylglutathione lyase family enzyme